MGRAMETYRVGECFYYEESDKQPYQIRRISELGKSAAGEPEIKVVRFLRKTDLPPKLAGELEVDDDVTLLHLASEDVEELSARELFLCQDVETIPVSQIRGRCTVSQHIGVLPLTSYLNKEDSFFYSLVLDVAAGVLLEDRGEIRQGADYQADIPSLSGNTRRSPRNLKQACETSVWTPDSLSDVELNRFLMLSSALGTYARALDSADSPQRPSAFEAAALATRDITKLHALDILHRTGYDYPQALAALMPSSGLTICRDEMESWSTFETDLFETAIQEHGKDFFTIRRDVMPWKTVKGIVEYYYFYKTTNRYLKHRQDKAVEAASKIKTIDVPSDYSQSNSLNNNCSVLIKSNGTRFRKPCKSCRTISSPHWYLIEKAQHCQACYDYWKRYARFRRPIVSFDADSLSDASSLHDGDRSPSVKPFPCRVTKCSRTFLSEVRLMKHYAINHSNSVRVQRKIVTKPFQFFASVQTKIRRKRLRRAMIRRRPARAPFVLMDYQAIERKYTSAMTADELKSLLRPNTKNRCSLVSVVKKLCASLYKNCIPEKMPDRGQPGSPPIAHTPKLTTNLDLPKPMESRLPVPWIPRKPCQPIDFATYQYNLTLDYIQNAKMAVRKTRSTKWHFARDRVRSWMEMKIVQREITYKRVSRNLYRVKDRRKSCITRKSQFSPVQFFYSNKRLKDSCRKYLKNDRFDKLARHPLKKAVARCDRCHESYAFLHMCG